MQKHIVQIMKMAGLFLQVNIVYSWQKSPMEFLLTLKRALLDVWKKNKRIQIPNILENFYLESVGYIAKELGGSEPFINQLKKFRIEI